MYPLGGVTVRYRPLVALRVSGPSGPRVLDTGLDSGFDDTLLPACLAVVRRVNALPMRPPRRPKCGSRESGEGLAERRI